ncbi:MAG TPA: hypothetical protein VMW44_00405, partial [Candidatus Bathyarchaeia archaeon]|nr:hypothetical protein [Candidatus Bathyarchaeia archaeon]
KMKTKQDVKMAIGIPLSWHYVPSDFFDSCLMLHNDFLCSSSATNKRSVEIIRSSFGPIHEMRNTIALRALEKDCTHLIFLDCDMVYPVNTIEKLLEHDKDIIGALTFKRCPDFNPLCLSGEPYKMTQIDPIPEELFKVTATGTGCLMIKTDVFETIDYPWFEFDTHDGNLVGEDINFCYKAKEKGFEVYIDPTVRTEHLSQTRVNWNLYQMQKSLKKQGHGFGF